MADSPAAETAERTAAPDTWSVGFNDMRQDVCLQNTRTGEVRWLGGGDDDLLVVLAEDLLSPSPAPEGSPERPKLSGSCPHCYHRLDAYADGCSNHPAPVKTVCDCGNRNSEFEGSCGECRASVPDEPSVSPSRAETAGPERPKRCPRCDSPSPERHPAVQFEGEVQVCPNVWHLSENEFAALIASKRREIEAIGLCQWDLVPASASPALREQIQALPQFTQKVFAAATSRQATTIQTVELAAVLALLSPAQGTTKEQP